LAGESLPSGLVDGVWIMQIQWKSHSPAAGLPARSGSVKLTATDFSTLDQHDAPDQERDANINRVTPSAEMVEGDR
jgi:hypothetical protein